jgi:hypothetical protein
MSLWGDNTNVFFELMDGDSSANTAGIAVQMKWVYDDADGITR